MLETESLWVKQKLGELNISHNTKILNFGSQYKKKLVCQFFLRRNVLAYIEERRAKIINFDIEDGEGVDVCGDILDVNMFYKLKEMKFDIILLNNVLEHVESIKEICDRIELILQPGGYILYSGPYKYPKHLDPIDNMFRAKPDEILAIFKNYKIIYSKIIKDHNWAYYLRRSPRSLITTILRLLTPFYKYHKWKGVVIPKLSWLFKDFEVTVVLLQKKTK